MTENCYFCHLFANGAMTKDLNKGISQIQYNSLNLPRIVDVKNQNAEGRNEYTYSASGVKLRTEQRYDPNLNITPSNTTMPSNDGFPDYKNTDYVGNIIYETSKTGISTINKIRVLVDGGYIENYYPFGTLLQRKSSRHFSQLSQHVKRTHFVSIGHTCPDEFI
jgi:hypothetical protein